MAKIFHAVLGVCAVTASLGVAQLASGSDLGALTRDRNQDRNQAVVSQTTGVGVNRASKSDRGGAARSVDNSRTISFQVVGQELSVAVRVPAERRGEARSLRPNQPAAAAAPKRMVACEPVVSVLTDIAKQLQPGRCLT
ncbi:hypothetical protein HNR60_004680 [Rhodopseudomonas rhenobacensis]|uniref:Uncharacterized protein n=1 Tax=Rhodopseudomonas rhenobacensis TaxID=87461 RepID=A0A7W8E1I1_9BRAD|nr:hypothetical protein [Rhodopseudomonas rhenobacensis]MBB5049895.1 hypothetical protein [Rhodopseudomonas rhenobacensis]